jgi:hypothetical protein
LENTSKVGGQIVKSKDKVLLIALVSISSLSACVALPSTTPDRPVTIESAEPGYKAAIYKGPEQETEQQALLQVKVDRDSKGCLVGKMDDGTQSVLIFPKGSTPTKEGVKLPEGEQFAVGDSVSFGGGHTKSSQVAEECSATAEPFLIMSVTS